MSNPVPITAMDITGYILLGTKRLNIRLTLDDIVPSYIEDGTTNKNQTEDERLTDENGQDELADEDQDELADEEQDELADEDQDELADEDQDELADEDQDELADEDQDELADEDEDEGAVSSVPGAGGEESEAEYRETEGPNGHHTADDSVGSLRRLLHPRTRQTGKSDDTSPDRRAVLANLQPTSTGSARAGSASSVVGTLRARAGAPATRASLPVHPVATVRQESGQPVELVPRLESGQPVELVPRLRQWSLRQWTNHCPSKTAGEMTMTTRPGGSATTNNR